MILFPTEPYRSSRGLPPSPPGKFKVPKYSNRAFKGKKVMTDQIRQHYVFFGILISASSSFSLLRRKQAGAAGNSVTSNCIVPPLLHAFRHRRRNREIRYTMASLALDAAVTRIARNARKAALSLQGVPIAPSTMRLPSWRT